jgi:L-lactate dehydrogenase
MINGNYGIEDVALSLPSIVNANGVKRIEDLNLTDDELIALRYSAEQLKSILNEVKDI